MGKSRFDYEGHGRRWICASDMDSRTLKRLGITASVKEVKSRCGYCIDGFINTGGRGHVKRFPTYSITKLREMFGK